MTPPERPDYLPPEVSQPQVNLDDLAWVGVDGEGNFDDQLAKGGYEPESPLRLIVRAIIAGHGEAEKWPWKREDKALAALTGSPVRGRRAAEDYDLLLEIARRWHGEFWRGHRTKHDPERTKPWEPPLDPIIRAVVPDHHPRCRNAEPDNVRKGLARKFRKDRDLLVARASSDDNFDRLDTVRKIRRVVLILERLGVKADGSVLRSRRSDRNRNPSI